MNAQQSLDQMAKTANAVDFDAQMNLISKDVSVFGVPVFDVISALNVQWLRRFS